MPKKYRAAVVGCGRIGALMELDPLRARPATHAGAFASSSRTELCALVDTNTEKLERARALFPETRVFTHAKEMLEASQPQLVAVAVPPEDHRFLVELCAAYRVPAIICEKPIALLLPDGEAMIKACRDADSLLFVNHSRRFDPWLGELAREIRGGALGDLRQGSGYYTAGLFNTGTHLVDFLRFLTGREAEWVSAYSEVRFGHPEGDANVNGCVVFEGNLPVTLQALEVSDYAIFEVHLYGSRGALVVDRFGFSVERTSVKACEDFEGYRELDRARPVRNGQARSFMAPLVEHVVDCLEGRSRPLSAGEDGLQALRILLALKESAARQGDRVYVRRVSIPG